MMTTDQIIRRLQSEGLVACHSMREPDMVVANGNALAWRNLFASALREAEKAVERTEKPKGAEYNVAYRLGFRHGINAAVKVLAKMREGL